MIDLLKSTSSLHNSTHILYTKENPKPNRLPKYMIKPLHILHPPFCFILGGSLCEDLGFFHSFKTSPRSSNSESVCQSYKPLHILHPPFCFILGGSLCEDLGFFHSFKTSPRSSNSESVCQSYHNFSGLLQDVLGTPWTRGFWPPLARGSVHTGVSRKCPLEPQRLVLEVGYKRALPPHRFGGCSFTF